MAIANPFDDISIYDKTLGLVGRIANPKTVSGSLILNGLSIITIGVEASDPNQQWLTQPGCRVALTYRGLREFSGMVDLESGVILLNGVVTFTIKGDWRVLQDTLAFVNPANGLAATSVSSTDTSAMGQATLPGGASTAGADGTIDGQSGTYVWPADVAETNIKAVISANFTRGTMPAIRPFTVAPNQGRGGNARTAGVLPEVRMDTLEVAVTPILAWSRLVLEIVQQKDATTIGIDVRAPGNWAADLTVTSGVVTDGSYSKQAPSATRAIVGGPGDGPARAYIEVDDATGLEAAYGYGIEVFRDGSSAGLTWPSTLNAAYQVPKYLRFRTEVVQAVKDAFNASMVAVGQAGLTAGLPTTSINAKLAETESFHFGGLDGVRLGDYLTIKTEGGVRFGNYVTEAQFDLAESGEFTVTTILGQVTDDTTRTMATAISNLAKANRKLSTSR